ncbi:MAG TPA: hypothetical protein VJ810_02815 [Blastocatellia bacterium]|nr:hypothetical protein [Blastocatellia bacterium]
MGDLVLKGKLDLRGLLTLKASGGKVKVSANEVLVELTPGQTHGTAAPPVILPPPPATPTDIGTGAVIINSLNKTVKVGTKAIVTQGMLMQGNTPTWPGMALPSQQNTGPVTINNIPINVVGDQGVVLPSGGTATFNSSGQ